MGYEFSTTIKSPYRYTWDDTAGHHEQYYTEDSLASIDSTTFDDRAILSADHVLVKGRIYDMNKLISVLEEFNELHRCKKCKFKFNHLDGKCDLANCNFTEAGE